MAVFGALVDGGYMLSWGPEAILGGSFTFQLSTAAYRRLSRTDTWRWVTQERIGVDPAEQFVGRGSKNITLEGVIYAAFNPGDGVDNALTAAVGAHVLDLLRFLADQGQPGMMVDGTGYILGQWVLVGIREQQEYFFVDGTPRKQEFTVEFRSFGPDTPLSQIVVPQPAQVPTATAAQSLANTLQNSYGNTAADAKAMASTLTGLGNKYGKTVKDSLPQMAALLSGALGLRGRDFDAMAVTLTNQNGNFKDWGTILNQGLPNVITALGSIGVTGKDAAINSAAILSTMDPKDGDRGQSMTNLSQELTAAKDNSALKAAGVDFNNQAVQPVDRYAAGIQKMGDLQGNVGTQAPLTAALPPASNPNLYDQAIQKSSGAFDAGAQGTINQGVTPSTPYTGGK